MSPVTVLGHSYLLNSEGKPFTLHCPLNSFIWKSFEFSFKCKTHSLPLRWGREVSPGLRVSALADLQEGVSSAGGFHVDHRLWLGVHAAQWADAASTRTRGSSDAQRFVSALITHVKWQLTAHFPVIRLKTRTFLTCWSCLTCLIKQLKRSFICVRHVSFCERKHFLMLHNDFIKWVFYYFMVTDSHLSSLCASWFLSTVFLDSFK